MCVYSDAIHAFILLAYKHTFIHTYIHTHMHAYLHTYIVIKTVKVQKSVVASDGVSLCRLTT